MNEIGLPNPLQELAEKLGSIPRNERWGVRAVAILTESVGTLLQAERAATIDLALTAFKKEFGEAQRSGLDAIGAVDCALDVVTGLATPDSSALSAVVQRETEKLRAENETLREEIAHLKDCL